MTMWVGQVGVNGFPAGCRVLDVWSARGADGVFEQKNIELAALGGVHVRLLSIYNVLGYRPFSRSPRAVDLNMREDGRQEERGGTGPLRAHVHI